MNMGENINCLVEVSMGHDTTYTAYFLVRNGLIGNNVCPGEIIKQSCVIMFHVHTLTVLCITHTPLHF